MHTNFFLTPTVSPDAIHEHVKTKIDAQETERLHYTAPEFAQIGRVKTSADIYAFGICALEVRLSLSRVEYNNQAIGKSSQMTDALLLAGQKKSSRVT